MKFEQPTFAQLGEQPLQTRLGLKKGWPLAPGNLDPQFPYGLSVSIPNVILRFQVWHKAILTSSLRIWAICRFLTTLDSQAWEIAWARIKQESQLELQLCMEHCCSRGWRHGIAHTGEEAEMSNCVLWQSRAGWHRHSYACDLEQALHCPHPSKPPHDRDLQFRKTEENSALSQ